MPVRSRLARERRRYTGETGPLARRGVGRGRTHGLDTCTPAQLELRALLFYFAFTQGPWNLSRMLTYDWDASAQYDVFVMANAGAPENLACTLGPKGLRPPGLPGLRLIPEAEASDYEFIHLPTGARLSVPAIGEGWYRDLADESPLGPLSAGELAALDDASSMSLDIKQLFAALLVRCSCRRRDGRWQMGQFLYACDEDFNHLPGFAWSRGFELTGSGDSWRLSWSLPVAPETITRPLLTPGIALPGAIATVERPAVASTIKFGAAELQLISR